MKAIFGMGPASHRKLPAPSHPSAPNVFTLGGVTCLLFAGGCNIGHSSPTLLVADASPAPPTVPTPDSTYPAATSSISANGSARDAGSEVSGWDDAAAEVTRKDASTDTSEVALACADGAYRCVAAGSAEREECDGGHWVAAAPCGSGRICEPANASTTSCVTPLPECDGGQCEACSAGSLICEFVVGAEDVAVACPNGTPRRTTCRDESPHCVSELGCKACSQTVHCDAEPPECYEYTCNGEFACELVSKHEGSPCAEGVCNAAQECVACREESDCGTPAACLRFTCESGACVEGFANERSSCASDDGTLCNDSGQCVECLHDNDCSNVDAQTCHRITCNSAAQCEAVPLDAGAECGPLLGDVCDGSGECVACVNASHCDEEEVCHDAECMSPHRDVGWFEGSEDAATAFADFVYLRRLEPLSHPATISSFGAIAQTTTTTAIDIGVYADNGDGTWPEGEALTVQRLEGILDVYQTTPAASHPVLEAGQYYWLGFRVSDDVELQMSTTPLISYDTGRRVQPAGGFGTDFYVANAADAPGGDSIEAYTVFAVIQYSE